MRPLAAIAHNADWRRLLLFELPETTPNLIEQAREVSMIDDRLQVLRVHSQVPAIPPLRIPEAAAIQDQAPVAILDHIGQPHHLSMHACLRVHRGQGGEAKSSLFRVYVYVYICI